MCLLLLEFGGCQDGSHITVRTLLPPSSPCPSTYILMLIRSIYIAAPPKNQQLYSGTTYSMNADPFRSGNGKSITYGRLRDCSAQLRTSRFCEETMMLSYIMLLLLIPSRNCWF
jgi:hypothetical protein